MKQAKFIAVCSVLAVIAACGGGNPVSPSGGGAPPPPPPTRELFEFEKWLYPCCSLAGPSGYGALITVEGPGTIELDASYKADTPGSNPNVILSLTVLAEPPPSGGTYTPPCPGGWLPPFGICLGDVNRLDENENPKRIRYEAEGVGMHYYSVGGYNLGPGMATVKLHGQFTPRQP